MSLIPALIAIAAALAVLGVVLNQVQARLGLVEVALTEGLPPGHQQGSARSVEARRITLDAAQALAPGLHVFVSRTCHACQRLVDEMEHGWKSIGAPVTLHHVDRPRPGARALADRLGFAATEHHRELAQALGADPLPFTIAVGDHELVARAVTPTIAMVHATARDAGMSVHETMR